MNTTFQFRSVSLPVAPRISVCMATWNGSKYVALQLQSILCQLQACDEVVIVDDRSTDGTVETLKAMRDSRIHVIVHEENQGVVRTFEDAIRAARGSLIFLSDQDDVWAPTKVEKFVHVFENQPAVTIVLSAVEIIDEKGRSMVPPRGQVRKRFRQGLLSNLLRNHYHGAAMAFRSAILPSVLPFPAGHEHCQLLHDLWIGACNAMWGGKTVYLKEPLLLYRRHGNNASGRMPFRLQVQKRILLVLALFRAWRRLMQRTIV